MNKLFPYKWELVFWLFIAFFFNQADRQIFNVLLLDIQTDLGLSSSQIGLVGTGLLLVSGILLPVAGILGDRFSKKWIIVLALLIWSTSTALTGLSTGLIALILLRSVQREVVRRSTRHPQINLSARIIARVRVQPQFRYTRQPSTLALS